MFCPFGTKWYKVRMEACNMREHKFFQLYYIKKCCHFLKFRGFPSGNFSIHSSGHTLYMFKQTQQIRGTYNEQYGQDEDFEQTD